MPNPPVIVKYRQRCHGAQAPVRACILLQKWRSFLPRGLRPGGAREGGISTTSPTWLGYPAGPRARQPPGRVGRLPSRHVRTRQGWRTARAPWSGCAGRTAHLTTQLASHCVRPMSGSMHIWPVAGTPTEPNWLALTSYRPPTRAPVTWLCLSPTSRERLVPPSLWPVMAVATSLLPPSPPNQTPRPVALARIGIRTSSPRLPTAAPPPPLLSESRLLWRCVFPHPPILATPPRPRPRPGAAAGSRYARSISLPPSYPAMLPPLRASAHARCDIRLCEGSRDTLQSALLCSALPEIPLLPVRIIPVAQA